MTAWVALFVCLFVCGGVAAQAQRERDPLAELSPQNQRLYRTYTGIFCRPFFRYGDDLFVLLPRHEKGHDNSSGRSADQARKDMTTVRTVRRSGFERKEREAPPEGEVVATAKIIPKLDVGHYGYVHAFTINEVLGPNEMIVGGLTLIPDDAIGRDNNEQRKELSNRQRRFKDKTYRVLGISTLRLKEGQVYTGTRGKGVKLAVMSTDKDHAFVLVSYDKLRRIRTHEFADLLAYVGLTPASFIDLVRDNRESKKTIAKGDQASWVALHKLMYDRYAIRAARAEAEAEAQAEAERRDEE